MNKKFKFTSAILSAGLLITPISGLVSNYNNVAKAEYKEINKSGIKSIVTFSDYEVYLAIKEAKENNEIYIDENKFKLLESKIKERGYWGENKIVEFWDGATDTYISGFYCETAITAGSFGIGTVISKIPKLASMANKFANGILGFSSSVIGNITQNYLNYDNGIIIYSVPSQSFIPIPPASGGNYNGQNGYWSTSLKIHHIRTQ